ncbi:hypothetical protein Gogos_022018 [Gossypium gossypioides]|uniref:RNase H type-1 domain-containing protein n=1 Tax=Gossypium gossypioides TaxID=34282 RepID=A0A7J9D691_GOSGO|nr:hypothetical protein [Gossypium gossypioides]
MGKALINFVKVNVDAAVVDNKTSFGVIIRYSNGFILGGNAGYKGDQISDGFVLGGSTGYKGDHMSMEWAELSVFIEGITLVRSLNFDKVIFESDCAS